MTRMTTTIQSPLPPAIRDDFPILRRLVHGKPLVYLDNAATTQKPDVVLAAIERYYHEYNANIHRGLHALAEQATEAYEQARHTLGRFINAPDSRQIIFTRGATESINLVAHAYGGSVLKTGDRVLITRMEHHSNIVPWQMVCRRTGASLDAAPIDDRGQIIVEEFARRLTDRTRIVAFTHVSNALGTINPVKELTARAKRAGAVVLIDGAQAAPHLPVDVQDLGCDFYAFSGHKMYGPTGIGVLWGRGDLLQSMPPWQGGGDMIKSVTIETTEYNDPPHRFEAGTPHIEGAIVLGVAAEYLLRLGLANVATHEHQLLEYGTAALQAIPGLRLIGTAPRKAGVLSFVIPGVHPYDMGPILDRQGVAVRTGHHCAQPVMDHFGLPATTRASLGLYNTPQDLDALAQAIHKAIRMLA
jgi:cysteine desulfurase/selenocysteine lyase